MARIRHLAVRSDNVPKLADFYKKVFGLKEVSRGEQTIYLSDGYINLAILPSRGAQQGIDHFGFEVDDPEGTVGSALEAGAVQGSHTLPRDGRFAEIFFRDPVGQRVDLSKQGWKS
jgi:catechol 2,3-dioxygenase-like lactoylglutathione lyase family enzyme